MLRAFAGPHHSRDVEAIADDSEEEDELGEDDDGSDNEAALAVKEALGDDDDGESNEINGNIYKFFAFMQFGNKKHSGKSLFSPPKGWFEFVVLMVGLVFIVIIQLFAPVAIFASNIGPLIKSVNFTAWHTYDITQWFVVWLAWAFLFCFILNAYKGTDEDLRTMKKVCRMAKCLAHLGRPVCRCFLIADAFINSYVAIALCICMFAILFQEDNAKNVVFDSLSLAFLLNIDDIASDLGFLGAVWDDGKVGRFYEQLRKNSFPKLGISSAADSDLEDNKKSTKGGNNSPREDEEEGGQILDLAQTQNLIEDEFSQIPKQIYKCTKCCLILLLILAIPAPFMLASNAQKNTGFQYLTDPTKMMNITQQHLANDVLNNGGHGHGVR